MTKENKLKQYINAKKTMRYNSQSITFFRSIYFSLAGLKHLNRDLKYLYMISLCIPANLNEVTMMGISEPTAYD